MVSKKKILWLCNIEFSSSDLKTTGGWLYPLAELIAKSGEVWLHNITLGNVQKAVRKDYKEIQQWIIPKKKSFVSTPASETCEEIKTIIDYIQPDLVHIWGTESIWASVYRLGYIKQRALLDIQGVLFAYTNFYYGGLTFKEKIQCIYLKEILMPWRTLFFKKKTFRKRGLEEIECLKIFKNISYQSNWTKNQIFTINPNANYFATKLVLRDNFYNAPQWAYKENLLTPIIFSSTSAAVSYKGIHVLIKSIALLTKVHPNIQLRIAGKINVGNKMLDGYSIFLNKLIREYKLQNNIILMGSLSANEIVNELLNCNVCVVPSFVETYCLAFAEAMMIGTPVVVSYAGAMPELADHNKEAMFYNSLDYVTCAAYIDELIKNKEKAKLLSINSKIRRVKENDRELTVRNQLLIYKNIIDGDVGFI